MMPTLQNYGLDGISLEDKLTLARSNLGQCGPRSRGGPSFRITTKGIGTPPGRQHRPARSRDRPVGSREGSGSGPGAGQ